MSFLHRGVVNSCHALYANKIEKAIGPAYMNADLSMGNVILQPSRDYSEPDRHHAVVSGDVIAQETHGKLTYCFCADKFSNDCQRCSNRQSLLHLLGAHHFETLKGIHSPMSNLTGCADTGLNDIRINVHLPCICTQGMLVVIVQYAQ